MVRLKEFKNDGLLAGALFQFHYGTIKRGIQQRISERCLYISIPLWYD